MSDERQELDRLIIICSNNDLWSPEHQSARMAILDRDTALRAEVEKWKEEAASKVCGYCLKHEASECPHSAEVETQKKAFKRCLDAMREEYQKREDLKYSSTIEGLRAELERVKEWERERSINLSNMERELDEAKRNGHCCDGFGSNCPREERRRRQEAHDKRHPS